MSTARGLGRGLGSLIPQGPASKEVTTPIAAGAPTSVEIGSLRVPIGDIVPNPEQPREHFAHAELEDLIASIKVHGVLQPLVVTKKASGGYELISGERRLRASKIAGLSEVPVVVRTAQEQEKLELALIENIQRADLNPIEEARAYRRLMEEYDLTQEVVAERLGKSRPQVANTMRLLDLPENIQQAVRDGQIPASAARALVAVHDPKEQQRLLARLLKDDMTVRAVEEMVRARKGGSLLRDPNVAAAEEALRATLGTRVDIHKRGAAGKIAIAFFSEEELSGLIGKLSNA